MMCLATCGFVLFYAYMRFREENDGCEHRRHQEA